MKQKKNSDTVVDEKKNLEDLVDGNIVRVEQAYPTEAVKHFHEKPRPTHEKLPSPMKNIKHFNQPCQDQFKSKK
jgi:hypothetical protein